MQNRFLFHVKQSAVELTRSMVPREWVTNVIGFDPWAACEDWQKACKRWEEMYFASNNKLDDALLKASHVMDTASRLMDEVRDLKRVKEHWEHKANELQVLCTLLGEQKAGLESEVSILRDDLFRLQNAGGGHESQA